MTDSERSWHVAYRLLQGADEVGRVVAHRNACDKALRLVASDGREIVWPTVRMRWGAALGSPGVAVRISGLALPAVRR